MVANDSVLYAAGFGVRDLSTGEPVTSDTRFGVGSTTKAFTATAIALAVDAGLMNFTDRVSKYLPEFQMMDPFANAAVTLKVRFN